MAANVDKTVSITALPLATTNLLGSSQVLTDPASLIKELIDNAIDAKATFIHVLISSDSLTKIEVHDNGHGISPVDLAALGKQGHTSKLRSFQELKFLGGTSLGFRGQALASATELGQVTVTTRTDGESIATTVKLKASGGIASQSHASHPVGTTVSVSSFLSKLPVRKENSLKEAPKTLSKIKNLVHSYALARPQMKFSLNVMNHRQGSWSFAPGSNTSIKYAVLQVIGKVAASQCVERTLMFPDSSTPKRIISPSIEDTIYPASDIPKPSNNDNAYYLQAFLPMKDADMSKIGGGQYISIDSRPMASNKGIARRIISLFKKHLRDLCAQNSSEKFKGTFLRLNIDCPVATYDPNVEPAKDDVLFENEELVLSAADSIFRYTYGNYSSSSNLVDNSPIREEALRDTATENEDNDISYQKWSFNMSKDYTKDVDADIGKLDNRISPRADLLHNQDIASCSSSKPSLNPWIIARINCPVPPKFSLQEKLYLAESDIASSIPMLPTNKFGQCNLKTSTAKKYRYAAANTESASTKSVFSSTPKPHSIKNLQNVQPLGDLRESSAIDYHKNLSNNDETKSHTLTFQNDFVTSRSLMETGFLSPPYTQQNTLNSPIPSVKNNVVMPIARSSMKNEAREKIQLKLPASYHIPMLENSKNTASLSQPNIDLDWAMDFEQRKEHATRRRRQQLLTQDTSDDAESTNFIQTPTRKIATLPISTYAGNYMVGPNVVTPTTRKSDLEASILEEYPRAYNMQKQPSITDIPSVGPGAKMGRARTLLLPWQNVPKSGRIHNLYRRIRTSSQDIRQIMETFATDDSYMHNQTYTIGIDLSKLGNKILKSRLQILVDTWTKSREGSIPR